MPIYENRANAENRVELSGAMRKEIYRGGQAFAEIAAAAVSGGHQVVRCDGWYGVDYLDHLLSREGLYTD